jgi:hypothetical protein
VAKEITLHANNTANQQQTTDIYTHSLHFWLISTTLHKQTQINKPKKICTLLVLTPRYSPTDNELINGIITPVLHHTMGANSSALGRSVFGATGLAVIRHRKL